jgi:protocatechuate 3,4-dioxygenase beta subunit
MATSHVRGSLFERRRFLSVLSGGLAVAVPGWGMAATGLWLPDELLPVTPTQTEGPFYPETAIEQQLFNDSDLVQRAAGHEFAKGQPMVVHGIVRDRKGQPLAGSVVEIWQACASGRYYHSRDSSNPLLLDNNFQFWGRAVTAEDGRYSFKTIVPGKYPGRTGRHIHYRIDSPQRPRLVTQCYFSDFGTENAQDGVYRQLDAKQRDQVTVQVEKPSDAAEPWNGAFHITMPDA